MTQLLLEIFSEEIPARMQKRATEDLAKLIKDGLEKSGITVGDIATFVAPRRLGLAIDDLPNETPDVSEEKKGPKVGAPQQAIDGFIRAAGISSIDEAKIVSDPKKGDFYIVEIVKKGAKTTDIIKELVPQIVRNFPWPKSMRWGEGSLRWVRPLHSIICLFGGEVVEFDIDGIKSGNKTLGHRFHSNGDLIIKDFSDYKAQTRANHVLIDREERKKSILSQAQKLCADNGLELIEDIGLLEEVCGLVDEPFVILGEMDKAFLDLPPEVIRLTLRINQKYFVVNSKETGKLAPYFIVVSNVNAIDGGKAIAHGNARVLAARLNDARYFWDLDRKSTLESRVPKLDTIVFHQKIGSIGDKVERIKTLAGELALIIGADVALAKRAALLCKTDLVTEMVGEFPELQGLMGRYYYRNDGGIAPITHANADRVLSEQKQVENASDIIIVADAIYEHYKPVGPSDYVPTNPISIAVALADKLDSLVSFFAIGEKPTGSGDPYALRRAALGIIRIVLENRIRLPLKKILTEMLLKYLKLGLFFPVDGYSGLFNSSIDKFSNKFVWENEPYKRLLFFDGEFEKYKDGIKWFIENNYIPDPIIEPFSEFKERLEAKDEYSKLEEIKERAKVFDNYCDSNSAQNIFSNVNKKTDSDNHADKEFIEIFNKFSPLFNDELLSFFFDRLKVYLKDEGFAHDIIDAVFAQNDDDLFRIVQKVQILTEFLKTEDGKTLLEGYKRAANILKSEEKKGNLSNNIVVKEQYLEQNAEKALFASINSNKALIADTLAKEDFADAMKTLTLLRDPIFDFLDNVLVNDSDNLKRLNRLALLIELRQMMSQVAEFEYIRG